MRAVFENMKWKAIIGLIAIYVATFYNVYWLWGILMLCWAIPDLIHGHTHLFELVTKTQNPITYWLIVLSWMMGGILLILLAIFPDIFLAY